jgi:hypothetical protein
MDEATEVTLYYENDEGEEVSYSAFVRYGQIGEILALMDELHD